MIHTIGQMIPDYVMTKVFVITLIVNILIIVQI